MKLYSVQNNLSYIGQNLILQNELAFEKNIGAETSLAIFVSIT